MLFFDSFYLCRNVVRSQNVTDNRRGIGAGLPDLRHVSLGDSTDRDDWKFRGGADLAKRLKAACGVAGVFSRRGEHRAETDVVCAASFRFDRLLHVMGGDAD